MGQCCQKLSGRKQPSESGKQVALQQTRPPISSHQSTRNDVQFTYFRGVFELLSLGEKLETPSFIDELHPQFSYQKFNHTYNEYQRVIKSLGRYISEHKEEKSQLNTRIQADRMVLQVFKAQAMLPQPGDPGCLVKVELQELKWPGVREVGIILNHPLSWPNKFEKWYPVEAINEVSAFVQFPVPKIKGAKVKIGSRPAKGQIVIDIEESFKKEQLLYCKIMKWKGAAQDEGIAIRIQMVSEEKKEEQERFQQMQALYQKLVKEYGVDGEIAMSLNDRQISERLSRHRTSLSNKYNLNANDMF